MEVDPISWPSPLLLVLHWRPQTFVVAVVFGGAGCLIPPLVDVPDGPWVCPLCEFGSDQGKQYAWSKDSAPVYDSAELGASGTPPSSSTTVGVVGVMASSHPDMVAYRARMAAKD